MPTNAQPVASLNILAVRGTGFPEELLLDQDAVRLQITQAPDTFLTRANEGLPSCVAIGPAWSLEERYLQQVLQQAPVGVVVLTPRDDVRLAHRIGLHGFSRLESYEEDGDWLQVAEAVQTAARDVLAQGAAAEQPKSSPSVLARGQRKQVVFSDPASKAMLGLVQRVAQVDVTVLLSGPSGVGKEVVAQILHNASGRAAGPFIALNCSAMPEHLVESILFGHTKGSFTGAIKDQPGIFEEAHNGTLFLDEVGELPLHIQPKLLRVIQERKAARIGSTNEVHFDVRLVAATNRNLAELVRLGEFREDLLYRLNAFHIGIPSLRERPEDIRQLAITFAASEQLAGVSMQIEEAAINVLMAHDWPGNVRELDNVICRAKVLAIHNIIKSEHIYFDALEFSADSFAAVQNEVSGSPVASSGEGDYVVHSSQDLMAAKEQAEWHLIQAALQETDSKKEAAERLGISPRTLRHKLQKLKASEIDTLQSIGAS